MTVSKEMKVLYVSAEVAPFAKVGGLADVAGSLPLSLIEMGHDVRVILPAYQMILDDPRWNVETVIEDFQVQMNPHWTKRASLLKIDYQGLPVYLIKTDEWFTESVESESVYYPGGVQHAFFSKALFVAMEDLGWIPDVLHCNDWHTGFIPVLLREQASEVWKETASVFTIHNLAYQGEFGTEALDWVGLPHWLFNYAQVEAWGRVNFLKSGCSFADGVTTVSPNYAKEIQTKEFGCNLEGLMQHLAHFDRLDGILNGLDTAFWDPATDKTLTANFSAKDLSGKAFNRQALLTQLDMKPIEGAPLFGMVSRLSHQKGFDLVLEAAPELFKLPIQLVVQGLGDPALVSAFQRLEAEYPNNFRLVNRFDAEMANQIYGGSDAFLMPSAFEPCGLGQLIAMRYGTVPVVRATGGLKDTVFEGKNGFVFEGKSSAELVLAVKRAAETFKDSGRWSKLQSKGASTDFGWTASSKRYQKVYQKALSVRRESVTTQS